MLFWLVWGLWLRVKGVDGCLPVVAVYQFIVPLGGSYKTLK